nr:MAG TPA: hypothetical protein [Caudoviricetes sp.]
MLNQNGEKILPIFCLFLPLDKFSKRWYNWAPRAQTVRGEFPLYHTAQHFVKWQIE